MILTGSEFVFLFFCITWSVLLVSKSRRLRVLPPIPFARANRYASMSAFSIVLAGFALAVALLNRVPVFRTAPINFAGTHAAAALLVAGLIWDRVEWRFSSYDRRERILALLPHDTRERIYWCCGTLTAAFSEEIFFRGVLFAILFKLTGDPWQAGIVASSVFAVFHVSYGWAAVAGIFFFALGFQALVQLSGTLYYAMAVHFLHDATIGLCFGTRPAEAETSRSS